MSLGPWENPGEDVARWYIMYYLEVGSLLDRAMILILGQFLKLRFYLKFKGYSHEKKGVTFNFEFF